MNIEERIDELQDAHRALAAQHTALMAICRVMLPLISGDSATVRRLLLSAYDIYSEHMEDADQDDEYQADVRAGIDLLSRAILVGVDIRDRRQTPPEASV